MGLIEGEQGVFDLIAEVVFVELLVFYYSYI